jgi:hypothetical protein
VKIFFIGYYTQFEHVSCFHIWGNPEEGQEFTYFTEQSAAESKCIELRRCQPTVGYSVDYLEPFMQGNCILDSRGAING